MRDVHRWHVLVFWRLPLVAPLEACPAQEPVIVEEELVDIAPRTVHAFVVWPCGWSRPTLKVSRLVERLIDNFVGVHQVLHFVLRDETEALFYRRRARDALDAIWHRECPDRPVREGDAHDDWRERLNLIAVPKLVPAFARNAELLEQLLYLSLIGGVQGARPG